MERLGPPGVCPVRVNPSLYRELKPPVGVEVVTKLEHARRTSAATMPELMSAAEIAEELGVDRQRAHQLRRTASFPAPLAELR